MTATCPVNCQWSRLPGGCDCATRLAAVTTHTRVPTYPGSPDICQECSAAVSDYVEWPCSNDRRSP